MLAEVFAWLRPNDLIWNYWVNNYLLGQPPPKAFDILYWNADTTRMTAALHRDFIDLALRNALTEPGGATMLGTPVDLAQGRHVDTYVVAGIADHLCPWQACYRTTQLLGGHEPVRAVDQRPHRVDGQPAGQPQGDASRWPRRTPADPEEWLAVGRDKVKGSLVARLRRLARRALRCGDATSRRRLAAAAYEPVCDAPGTYVHDR